MQRDCTIHIAKTKALISFAVTEKLICVFVFAYAKSRFSHNEAHIASVHKLGHEKTFILHMLKQRHRSASAFVFVFAT